MSQRDSHYNKRHRADKWLSALRLKNQCELVNKVASVSIWATDRLYKKWRGHASEGGSDDAHPALHGGRERHNVELSEQQPPLHKHNAHQLCQRHGNYYKASLARATLGKATIQAGRRNAGQGHASRRRRGHSRPDAFREQSQHRRRRLSSETNSHCQRQQQEGRTSDIDWPDDWPSIWGSSATPKCASGQRDRGRGGGGGGGRARSSSCNRVAAAAASVGDTAAADCRARQVERHHRGECGHAHWNQAAPVANRHRGQRQPRTESRSRHRYQAGNSTTYSSQKTVEALRTVNSSELDSLRKCEATFANCDTHKDQCRRLQGEPPRYKADDDRRVMEFGRKCRAPSSARQNGAAQERRSVVDKSTYTIKNAGPQKQPNNIGRLSSGSGVRRPNVQAEQLQNRVVWLTAEQPTSEQLPTSVNDGTMRINELISDCGFSNASYMAPTRTGGNLRTTMDAPKEPPRVHKNFAAASIACNNSVDGRSLKMLSSSSHERECDDEKLGSSGPMCAAALISHAKFRWYMTALCNTPKVKMQSNAAAANKPFDTTSNYSEDEFQTLQVVGESKGVEPKTGSVSRYVQDEVLKAAKLVATKGFAGLVGNRSSDVQDTDTNITDTVGTDDDGNQVDAFDNRDSLGEFDDLDYFDDNEEEEGEADAATPNNSPPRPKEEERQKMRREKERRPRKAAEESPRQQAKGNKLLPMTQCPTTQHRIECYRTRSGKVMCYMTARHPVKCCVQDGRIVCKATVRPEHSHLPYPCNAAWQ